MSGDYQIAVSYPTVSGGPSCSHVRGPHFVVGVTCDYRLRLLTSFFFFVYNSIVR